jgi:hypothetical protein
VCGGGWGVGKRPSAYWPAKGARTTLSVWVAAIKLDLDLPAHFLDVGEQRAGFVLLAAFLGSFLFIRTSARLMRSPKVPWWPGSVTTSGGLHLHHLVWGMGLLLISGFLAFVTPDTSPTTEILAGMFGVGAGLTLDEFALLIYLRDVYWAEEGRASLDAVIVATMLGGLIVVGFAPFDLKNNSSSVDTLAFAVATDLVLAVLVILKGKHLLGLIGLFIPFVSIVGVFRLASPRSPWARRFYKPGGRKLARSQARWERIAQRRRRWGDAIAGAPASPAAVEPPPSPDQLVDRGHVRDA